MSTSEQMISQFRAGHKTLENNIAKITDENIAFRLGPELNSVGFLVRHIAETEHGLGHLLFKGPKLEYERKTVGKDVSDKGEHIDIEAIIAMYRTAESGMEEAFMKLSEADWDEVVEHRVGTLSRRDFVAWVIAHSAYHTGQIGMTLKHGRQW